MDKRNSDGKMGIFVKAVLSFLFLTVIIPVLYLLFLSPVFAFAVLGTIIIGVATNRIGENIKESEAENTKNKLGSMSKTRNNELDAMVNNFRKISSNNEQNDNKSGSDMIASTQMIGKRGLARKILICCYQTARLNEQYCPCGRAVDKKLQESLDLDA